MILDFSRRSLNSLVSVATCQGSAKSPKEKHFTNNYTQQKNKLRLQNFETFFKLLYAIVFWICLKCVGMKRGIFCGVYRLQICLVRRRLGGQNKGIWMKTKHGANIFTDDNRWKFVQIYELAFAPSSTLLAPNIFNLFWHHLYFSMLNYRTETTMKGISNIQWNYSAHLVEAKLLFEEILFFLLVNASVRVDWKVHCCTLSQTWSGFSNWIEVNPELFVNF